MRKTTLIFPKVTTPPTTKQLEYIACISATLGIPFKGKTFDDASKFIDALSSRYQEAVSMLEAVDDWWWGN